MLSAQCAIATEVGDAPVERLQPGDRVKTVRNGLVPVKWIGARNIDCRRHPEPTGLALVRILPHAFGEGVPAHDLWLSPDHAVYTHGQLVPIRLLINGATIVQERTTTCAHYVHVELAQHDLLAEGLPAESYLDTGNRTMFESDGRPLTLHPNLPATNEQRRREQQSCAPFCSNRAAAEGIALSRGACA